MLVGLAPLETVVSRWKEAGFTSSSGGVRASLVYREKGTERPGTMRNRSEPSQVTQGEFRAWANRGYPEGTRLLLRARTERKLLVLRRQDLHQRRRKADKGSLRCGEVSGEAGRIFQQSAISKTRPLACEQKAT